MMRFAMQIDYADLNALQTALQGIPGRIEKNVLRAAGRKGARFIADRIKSNTRVAKRQTRQSKTPHLRDTVTVKQRTYRKQRNASVTYFAIGWGGAPSRVKPNAHLVEEGTAQRFTGSKTDYENAGQKKIKTRKGWVFKKIRKSIGSKAIAGAIRKNRGIMPAFRPTQRAFSQTEQQARQVMLSEIKSGIDRALRAEAKRNVKAFGGIGL